MPPTAVADVLAQLGRDPGRPRLTWYGPDHERVELSGHVLDNWVTKTANLLVEELDAAPGARVALDLPVHWRAVVWALATWRTGATLVLGGPGGRDERDDDADVVVTTTPVAGAAAAQVAVSLGALARRFEGDLPSGAVDAASSVMTYGDVLGWVPPADPGASALVAGDDDVRHADLVAWATAAAPMADGARVLLLPAAPDAQAWSLAATLAALAADGSVVLCEAGVAATLAEGSPERERLVGPERVTDVLAG